MRYKLGDASVLSKEFIKNVDFSFLKATLTGMGKYYNPYFSASLTGDL